MLSSASELAPQWPYPVYDKAFTYLLMDDFEAARTHYQRTLELAPRGFFTATTAFDVLTREQSGEFESGTYRAYVSLEWMGDAAQKEQIVRQLVDRFPSFAPAWKDLANLADDDAARLAAIEKGLAAEPDAETLGILQISKAMVLNGQGHYDASIRLLGGTRPGPTLHACDRAFGQVNDGDDLNQVRVISRLTMSSSGRHRAFVNA